MNAPSAQEVTRAPLAASLRCRAVLARTQIKQVRPYVNAAQQASTRMKRVLLIASLVKAAHTAQRARLHRCRARKEPILLTLNWLAPQSAKQLTQAFIALLAVLSQCHAPQALTVTKGGRERAPSAGLVASRM